MADIADGGPRVWLTRTGEGGYALRECVQAGVVALRYSHVGDATLLSLDEIAEGVKLAGTRSDHRGVARMVYDFVHTIRIGDIVMTPHQADREVYFGEVTGAYQFCDPSPVPGLRHLRKVEWWGSLDRDTDIAAERLADIDRPPTLYALSDQSHWLDRVLRARSTAGAVTPPSPGRPPSGDGGGRGAARAASVATAICNSCGLHKPAGIIESGVCADCR